MEGSSFLGSLKDWLDFVRVDDSGKISIGHDGSVKVVVLLLLSSVSVSTENLVKGLESGSSPDDEPTELSTGGELEEI